MASHSSTSLAFHGARARFVHHAKQDPNQRDRVQALLISTSKLLQPNITLLRDNLACTVQLSFPLLWDPPVMGFGDPQVMHLGFGDRISAASPPRCQLLSPGKWPVGSIVIRKGSSQWKRSRCTRSHNTSKVQGYQTLILQT